MCCIPNQRHREAEREKCYFWRILWRFRGESDIPAESWLMSGSWPSIEIEESLQRETCICKDCKCEGTQHGAGFGARGEVLGVPEPEVWTGEGSLWKSCSVYGLCSVAGLFCCKHPSLQAMDKLTICFRTTLPVQRFSKCGPGPPGAASPENLMKNPNFHPQCQPSESEILVMGSGNLCVVSRHPAYPDAHLRLGTTVPVPVWEMQWVNTDWSSIDCCK